MACGACSSSSAPNAHTSPTLNRHAPTTTSLPGARFGSGAPACTAAQLAIEPLPPLSPPSGHAPVPFALKNTSASPCQVDGYPAISMMVVGGATAPFTYHDGGNLVVTAAIPRSVVIPAGHDAFVTLDQSSCATGPVTVTTTLRVTPPGQPNAVMAALPLPSQPTPTYCGASDPSSTIYVSPIMPTFSATLQSH